MDAARILRWSAPALRLLIERARNDARLPVGDRGNAGNLGAMLDALGATLAPASGTERLSTLQTLMEEKPSGLEQRPTDSRALRTLLAAHVLEVVLAPVSEASSSPSS